MKKKMEVFLKQGVAVMMSLSLAFGPCAPGSRPVFGAQTGAEIDTVEVECARFDRAGSRYCARFRVTM